MRFVADTHALLWHLYDPDRLGAAADRALRAVDSGREQVAIPALVVAEMLTVIERGRLPGVTIEHALADLTRMQSSANYRILPLYPATVIASHTLTTIRDLFDRLIVAEARRLGLPLITRDAAIRSAGIVTTIWE